MPTPLDQQIQECKRIKSKIQELKKYRLQNKMALAMSIPATGILLVGTFGMFGFIIGLPLTILLGPTSIIFGIAVGVFIGLTLTSIATIFLCKNTSNQLNIEMKELETKLKKSYEDIEKSNDEKVIDYKNTKTCFISIYNSLHKKDENNKFQKLPNEIIQKILTNVSNQEVLKKVEERYEEYTLPKDSGSRSSLKPK